VVRDLACQRPRAAGSENAGSHAVAFHSSIASPGLPTMAWPMVSGPTPDVVMNMASRAGCGSTAVAVGLGAADGLSVTV
jgi:hypothetical protein